MHQNKYNVMQQDQKENKQEEDKRQQELDIQFDPDIKLD